MSNGGDHPAAGLHVVTLQSFEPWQRPLPAGVIVAFPAPLNFKRLEGPHLHWPHRRLASLEQWGGMLAIMKESAGNVVGVRATGMLTTADYDRVLIPKLAELSQKFETLRVLFYMDQDFRGWDLSAAWANTRLDFRFRGNLDKVAIAGAPAWEEWCVRVASVVMKGELQTFRAEQLEDAWEWVRP